MKITTGYSREHPGGTKWSRMDVTLEEVDFQRFLADNGIDQDVSVKPNEVYRLMILEAERFTIMHQASEGLVSGEFASTEVGNIRKTQNEILAKLKGQSDGSH